MERSVAFGPPGRRTKAVVSRFFYRWLWSFASDRTLAETISFQRRSYERAIVIVRVYYVISVYWILSALSLWPTYLNATAFDPMWPTRWWFEQVSIETGVNVIVVGYLVAGVLVVLAPELRLARALYAFALLQYMAIVSTPDKPLGDMDAWLFIGIFLIFLPRGPWTAKRRVADRQYFLMVIWSATLVVLFFYSLAGMWKVRDASLAFINGELSGFSRSGFSYIIGQHLTQTNQETVLGRFFVFNETPGWALLLATMYLEGASIIIAFRPHLHRLWGVALIAFHLGTQVVMGFTFPKNIVVFGLLLVCSPFAPDRIDFKQAFLDLPGVHFIVGRIRAVRARSARRRVSPEPSVKS